jgi:hypothetical protein
VPRRRHHQVRQAGVPEVTEWRQVVVEGPEAPAVLRMWWVDPAQDLTVRCVGHEHSPCIRRSAQVLARCRYRNARTADRRHGLAEALGVELRQRVVVLGGRILDPVERRLDSRVHGPRDGLTRVDVDPSGV